MYLGQDTQVDTAGAIVSAQPADASPVDTITVTATRPNWWPWIVGGLVVAVLLYLWMQEQQRKGSHG
jgi:hypothetical protein